MVLLQEAAGISGYFLPLVLSKVARFQMNVPQEEKNIVFKLQQEFHNNQDWARTVLFYLLHMYLTCHFIFKLLSDFQ